MRKSAAYREWQPVEPLRRHVACMWAGRLADDGTPYADAVLPDGCMDIVWDGARLFVAGPDTGPAPMERTPGASFVGLRFRPGYGPTVLSVPASDLLDSRADGDDVLGGRRAAPLAERLHAAPSARAATRELEAAMLDWLRDASPPDPAVEAVVRTLAGGRLPVSELADGVGLSERQLHRRCTSAVGYGPKTLDRVLRFRRFLALASAPDRAGRPGSAGERPPATLATLAVDAGYADQAHLTRECVRLAGRTPAALTSTSHR